MVDRERLAMLYRKAVTMSLCVLAVPALLVFIASVLAGPDGGDSQTADMLTLVILGGMGVIDPIATWFFAQLMSRPKVGVAATADTIYLWSLVEYMVWEVSALLGFVGLLVGAEWWFLLAGVLLAYAGFALSFPRWSTWESRADAWDALMVGSPVVS